MPAPTGDQVYWVRQLAEGLRFPSSMAWLPNGDMLVTERMGGLRVIRQDKLEPNTVTGVPASFQSGPADGLKDILVDPDFATSQALYLLMSEGASENRHAAVYRAQYSNGTLKHVERIFRTKGEDSVLESGTVPSRMMLLADTTLLIGVAEDFKLRAQQLDSHMGKILRINRDGSIPKDNPFVNVPGALPEIWSYGHRVVLGLYQEPQTAVVWEVESGPRGGDELNVLKPGSNYGWATASWGFKYNNTGSWASQQSGPGIEDPLLIWMPSVTPSGLTRYHGTTYPLWNGDYFIGHLTTKELERVRIEGRRVVLQERMLLHLEERIRDVKVGPDDHLYLLTDHQNGRLLRLEPGQPLADQLPLVAHKLETTWVAPDIDIELGDPRKGRLVFLSRCAACHSVTAVVRGGEIGPDLAGVFGRHAGSKPGFDYSKGLMNSGFTWRAALLDRFLADPNGTVPGTKMMVAPLTDKQERRDVIGFLNHYSK